MSFLLEQSGNPVMNTETLSHKAKPAKSQEGQFGSCRRLRFDPWVQEIPCRKKWQPTPMLLPRKSHGQRTLAGYGPKGCKEEGTTEQTDKMPCSTLMNGRRKVCGGQLHIYSQHLSDIPRLRYHNL